MTTFTLNGKKVDYNGDSDMPLLWYLRDIKGYTGTKFGCGIGQCGACTVHLDGVAVRSCQTPMDSLEATSQITTIEGLTGKVGDKLKEAWRDNEVPQCGYCQAGQIMQAASLLTENPSPSETEIEDAMYGNLCRCGTYQRIKKAISAAAGDKS